MEESRRVNGNKTAEDLVREYYRELYNPKINTKSETPNPKRVRKKAERATSVQAVNLSDYLLLPSHDIYVAKERSLKGNNWHNTHKEAHKQKARMLTLKEFADFLLLLRSGKAEDGLGNKIAKAELDNLYLDITEVRDPYRAEWLDAKFEVINGVLNLNYLHRISRKVSIPRYSVPLETCVMKNCKVELSSFNNQGIPTKEGTDFNYWAPTKGRVARFIADAGGADLDCDGYPDSSYGGLGVRLVREK